MASQPDFARKILNDIKIKLSDEFDRNFERKAFFSQPWKERKNGRLGSLMAIGGGRGLRGSILSRVEGDSVKWTSSMPYAEIHNEGGEIEVTAKMKRFFWRRYYELAKNVIYRRDGTATGGTAAFAAEALLFKSLALKKVGDKIIIPQRRFIGDAPEVDAAVEKVVENVAPELERYITEILRRR